MILVFVFVFGAWILSLSFHEFSHALVAYWGGDTSVKEKGYLTFNPLKYTHPVLTFLIPILFLAMGGIGLPGGAVYIDRRRLRGPGWDAAVSLAGPLSNALLAGLLALPFVLGLV
ncbi:MAG: site-2 protease family protein, partial [Planctomycetes bacterium]|nr:site-2 protease family protein [Planctomycetota bacterium]